MERDRESSDSSSWSLVDVNDSDGTDASDIDSVGDELIVESVHDSDSDSEYSENGDEVERLSEAEEATEESELDEPEEADDTQPIVQLLNDESDYEPEESEHDDETSEGELEAGAVEVVEEDEALAESAAKHYVEPAKVAVKFEELSKALDTPFDRFFESISSPESGTRPLIFAIVMLITVLGAGCGHYIGSSLMGNKPLTPIESGPFCFESDRISTIPPPFVQQPGLQYRDAAPREEVTPSPLQQCKENLHDAQANVRMKSVVNRFVRENYKHQLQKAKQEFQSRLELYKRASRRLLASKFSESKKPSPIPDSKEEPTCSQFDRPLLNLTLSIFNWTTSNSVVKNLLTLSPTFDKQLEKVSTWLRKTNNFSQVYQSLHSLTKVPKLSKALNEVPKKAWNFLRSDFRSYAKKVTTALSKTNFQTKLAEYKKHPIVQKFQKRVESALSRLSQLKTHAEVCFASKSCEYSQKFAKNLEKVPEFASLIGKRQAKEYIQYLTSLTAKNCSIQMNCEKDWWMGCGPQFLENCALRKWQTKRSFSGAALINRNPKMKEAAIELEWIAPQDRRKSIRCCHLSNSPLPCPTSKVLPTLPRDPLAPCHLDPNSAQPCRLSPATPPRPCPAANQPCKPFSKPSGNGRPDWFSQRAKTREQQRQAHSSKSFHFKNRRKHL